MSSDIFYLGMNEDSMVQMFMAVYWVMLLIALALLVVVYVLQARGLYTIARERGIKKPWLAWVPLGDCWILGSISDRHRLMNFDQLRNRRTLLTVLYGAGLAAGIVQCVLGFRAIFSMLTDIENLSLMDEDALEIMIEEAISLGTLGDFAVSVVNIVGLVFYYICLHDLYASCCPYLKTVYLVLSIFVPVTIPFFIFACRKYGQGMKPEENLLEKPEI